MPYIKEQHIGQLKNITIYNTLALLVVLTGIPLTIVQGRAVLQNWTQSGKRFPFGVWDVVDLKETDTLVYYESSDDIPTEYVNLVVKDAGGSFIKISTPTERNDFSYKDKQGLALFELYLPQPGSYSFIFNDALANNSVDNPQQNEVVFAKSPNSKAQATNKSILTYIIGGASTLGLAAILYIIHVLWLKRKQVTPTAPPLARFTANIGVPEE